MNGHLDREAEVREIFCELGRRVWAKDMVASNDGNFSFRLSEDRVLCTPTMISKGFMRPEDMVIMDLDGTQVGGTRRGTSEVKLHLFIYRHRPDVHSVVHVHPPHATAFAVSRRELPKCILPEVEILLGEIPMVPYETTGTWEFARSVAPWIRDHDCLLLTNHGAVTVGADPFDAYYKMETLEQYCRILTIVKQLGGEWNAIDGRGMAGLLDIKRRLGIREPRAGAQLCAPGAIATVPDAPLPAEPFVPSAGPIVDGPKAPALSAQKATPSALSEEELRRVVEEVTRRVLNR